MARLSALKSLDVWMNNSLVGRWNLLPNAKQEFRYASSWLESEFARPLSLSMPLQPNSLPHKSRVVEHYFENLLPDSDNIRRRIAQRYSAESLKAFDLLLEIGRDCVGAVQLLEPGLKPPPQKGQLGKPISTKQMEKILAGQTSIATPGMDFNEGFRISLTGAQEKTAFIKQAGKWYVPSGSMPTTHIFKLPLGKVGNDQVDLSTSVENEWLCLQIARAYGLRVAKAKIHKFGKQSALSVERFDRKFDENTRQWIRLPQEDICQALGVSPLIKYQSQGGPGIKDIMDLLLGSSKAEADRNHFFKSQILFWMLAAPDGHAKNFSIYIQPGGTFHLSPLYDIISAYPLMGKGPNKYPVQKIKLAMYLKGKNKHYHWDTITRSHFISTAKYCGLSRPLAESMLNEMADTTEKVIKKVAQKLPAGSPKIARDIFKGLEAAAKILQG